MRRKVTKKSLTMNNYLTFNLLLFMKTRIFVKSK